VKKLVFALPVLIALFLLPGCRRDEGDPEQSAAYAQAKQSAAAGEFKAAAAFYRQVLDEHPRFAIAHRELGLLYDEKLGDPIAAIYHYRRYIELEPNSDKRRIVEDFIERAKLSLVARLPQQSGLDTAELVRLQNQNDTLAAENAALKNKLAERDASATNAPAVAVVAPAPTNIVANTSPITPKPRIHIVQKGETLQAIALRYYGARSAWDKIYQANRATMSGKDQLRIGQQLVIP
jgi:nucleoid-associated protein YgaU